MSADSTACLLVPTYNEEGTITDHLTYHTRNFKFDEIVVIDGGSRDDTTELVKAFGDPVTLITTDEPGRGSQLRKGQKESDSSWIILLHADTFIPEDFEPAHFNEVDSKWGWFDCRLDDESLIYRVIEGGINIRTALFSSPTGDQAIWIYRDLLERAGGIPEVPIMEDLELTTRLRRHQKGHRVKNPVRTSARKWKKEGVLKVILSMWWFRLAYFAGASPEWIYQRYYQGSTETG